MVHVCMLGRDWGDGYMELVQLTLMVKALLKPEAKKPPKGAMREAKMERGKE